MAPLPESEGLISVVTCSIDDSKFARFRASLGTAFREKVELIRVTDARSLAEGYNRGAQSAHGDIVIFCHDDIEILNDDFGALLRDDLARYDLVGVAGTSRLVEGNWVKAGQPHVHGQVAHGATAGVRFSLCQYGLGRDPAVVENIQALDGLFFAVHRGVLNRVGFDDTTFDGFHLYDLDFTYAACLCGFRLVVDHRIHLLHASEGRYDQNWARYAHRFNEKYARHLLPPLSKTLGYFKALNVPDLQILKGVMGACGDLRRIELCCEDGEAGPCVSQECSHLERVPWEAIGELTAGSVDYLRVRLGIRAQRNRIALMNQIARVCSQGAIVDMVQDAVSPLTAETCWQLHDFFSFDARQPDYLRFSRDQGFCGDLYMNHCGIDSTAEGTVFQVIYQVNRASVSGSATPSPLQRGSAPVVGKHAVRGEGETPRFSIIVPHYQGSISHDQFLRGMRSLLDQSCQDFEILCYHDGPLIEPGIVSPVEIEATANRFNDWGHSLRDMGIRAARGEYILHFNPDNVLYPDALEVLSRGTADLLVFPVKMMGLERNGHLVYYSQPRNYQKFQVLDGRPLVCSNVDCMQVVMKRQRWLEVGGWFDKREASDGFMYPLFARFFGVEYLGEEPLGEHW